LRFFFPDSLCHPDGKADIIMGANEASPSEGHYAGSTYVYFGKASGWPTSPYNLGGL
jgi:hypothetical protein